MSAQMLEAVQEAPRSKTKGGKKPKPSEDLWDTFRWNQRKALSHLLTMEEHMKELDEEDIKHGWCIVKHYLLALDHHVEEAIGHAERLGVDSTLYRSYHEKLEKLNAYPQPAFTLPQLLKLRTEWRQIIQDPTLVGDCPLCATDVPPEVLAQLRGNSHIPDKLKEEILGLERKYAQDVMNTVSKHSGKDPTHFMILNCGPDVDPSGRGKATVNEHGEPLVTYCAGGINAHTILHEEDHYRRHGNGECNLTEANCPEDKAETYALSLNRGKILNTDLSGQGHEGTKKMVGKYEIVGIYGASIAATGVEMYAPQLDVMFPQTTPNFWTKPSTLAHIALGVIPPVAVLFMGKKNLGGKFHLPLMVFASHITSNLIKEIAVNQGWLTPPITAVSIPYRRYAGGVPIISTPTRVSGF